MRVVSKRTSASDLVAAEMSTRPIEGVPLSTVAAYHKACNDRLAMGGNPPGSKWKNVAREERKRPKIELSLSPEALELLKKMAGEGGRSNLVELLIFREAQRQGLK